MLSKILKNFRHEEQKMPKDYGKTKNDKDGFIKLLFVGYIVKHTDMD